MAGIALIIDQQDQPQFKEFKGFLETVATCKSLEIPTSWAKGTGCIAAKLDGPASIHTGIEEDATGSWLLAAGTVIDTAHVSPNGSLRKIMVDYLTHGDSVFSRLDSQFALVLYHARDEQVLVVSDPFGLIPVYYGQKGPRWFVSTSALAVARAVGGIPDEFAIRSFLLYGSAFGDTLWRDVYLLPPAAILKIGRDGIQRSTYWSLQPDPAIAGLSLADSLDCMVETLSNSLRRSLKREGRIWISLTGGMDSRMLAALAYHCQIPFKTYCHGPTDSRDVRIAQKISREMGWEHEYLDLPEDWGSQRVIWLDLALGQTDGLLNLIKMSRTVREQAIKARQSSASLWGYGGELFRGYYWKQEFWRTGATPQVDYERLLDYRVIPASASILENGAYWKESVRAEVKNRLQKTGEQQPACLNTQKLDRIGLDLDRHASGITIGAVLGQQRVILPFYFKENVRSIFSVHYKWRTFGRMFRLILERISPRLAEMETADGGPALPMRLSNFYRFIPFWMDSGEKLLWKKAYQVTGKTPWRRRDAGPEGKTYPTARWLQNTVSLLNDSGILLPDKMVSAGLYNQKFLRVLGSQPIDDTIAGEKHMGRILAVEMAFRFTGHGL